MSTGMAPQGCAQIVAEIAERLVEIEGVKSGAGMDLVRRLAIVAERSPRLFRPTCAALSGDVLEVVNSFAVTGDRRGLTKQAIHFEWDKEVAKLRQYLPDLSDALQELRDRADNHDIGKHQDNLAHGWSRGGQMEAEELGDAPR
jgi:hypothetical protein